MAKILALRVYTSADLASSDTEKADWTEIRTIGITKGGNFLGLDRFSQRGLDQVTFIKEFFRQMIQYKSERGYIEKNRAENLKKTVKRLIDTGYFGEDKHLYKKLWGRIVMIPHYVLSKQDRIVDNLGPEHSARHIWIKDGWETDRTTFALYPAVTHDDILDAWEMVVSNGKRPENDFVEATRVTDARSRVVGSFDRNAERLKRKFNIWTGVRSG